MNLNDTTLPRSSGKLADKTLQGALRIIHQVPLDEYRELVVGNGRHAPPVKGWRKWFLRRPAPQFAALHPLLVSFSNAMWLRFTSAPSGNPVSMWLQYEDADGLHQVLVDEVLLESAHLMLAGEVTFRVQGFMRGLVVGLAGCTKEDRYVIDELLVQRKRRSNRPAIRPAGRNVSRGSGVR